MGDWALASGFRSETFNTGTGNNGISTSVTSSATANTKGSWSQLSASTSFEASAILLHISTQFIDTRYLIDIGIGAAGSEQVIIPNLLVGISTGVCFDICLPISVPAGSRLAARCQDNFGSSVAYVSGSIFAGGFMGMPSFASMTDYGTSTSTSGGTTVDAGATANTKGSYTQIAASTTYAHKGLVIAAMRPTPGTNVTADYFQLADLAIGASGSEQILLNNLRFVCSTVTGGTAANTASRGTLLPNYVPPLLCDIPAGSRIAMRQQSSSTNTTDRTCAYAVYGLN